jgi:hypothetical protein
MTDTVLTGAEVALPFIDAHTVEVDAPGERVWDVLVHAVLPRFGAGLGPLGGPLTRLAGCPYTKLSPPGAAVPETLVGFRVAGAERPTLVELEGRHRFARYTLTFRIDPVGDGSSRLSAETRAAFPGTAGRGYRAFVIGTGGHVFVVRRLLLRVRRLAARP